MKISYKWLQEYCSFELTPEQVSEILTDTGLEVEGLEKIETIPGGLAGLVVGHVVTCGSHPNADKLSLTEVDLGAGDPVQIVCGAPNVGVGQKVIVATVGTTLYPSEGDPFKIKKGKIRGEVSMGMICAEDEIGLGVGHEGIMVLPEEVPAGTLARDYFRVEDDYCIEIGLTPNRTDAMSHFGVARDLRAAIQNMEAIENKSVSLQMPDVTAFSETSDTNPIAVRLENTDACPRYAGISIRDVKVGPSPEWMQNRLRAIGLQPINNIVDVTNFVLHELGQPLHAFDADKIEGNTIIVKNLPEGTSFKTLDEVERKLSAADLMICDANGGLCIAGVFGGIDSGVSKTTTNVFLESAYFDAVSVRKTAKRHGLNTDASFRFERGVDPTQVIVALKRAALLIAECSGGKITGQILDEYPQEILPKSMAFSIEKSNQLIGKTLEKTRILGILKDLDILVKEDHGDMLELIVPQYRVDVTREADVTEEILRIYGYNSIETPLKLNASLSYAPVPDHEKIRNSAANILSAQGFNEIMSNSLTKESYVSLAGKETINPSETVKILNPLSNDLNVLRQTMLFSGLESIERNQNHRHPDLRLYEFGRVYAKTTSGYEEGERLAIFLTGRKNAESWNNEDQLVGFSDLMGYVQNLMKRFNIWESLSFSQNTSSIMRESIALKAGEKHIVSLGSVSSSILKSFGIKQEVWYASIDWDQLVRVSNKKKVKFNDFDKFPAVRRDLSLLVNSSIQFADVQRVSLNTERKLLKEVGLFDVYEGKNLEAGKKSYAVSFTLQDSKGTLNDKTIEKTMSRIQQAIEKELGASLR